LNEPIVSKVVRVDKEKDTKISIKGGIIDAYKDFSLKVQQMELKKGKIYSVSAAQGTGKSTFLKSLAGLVNSNFECQIEGKVSYVDPAVFHLPNALCSIYDTFEIEDAMLKNE
jgi:translation initiation factor RLI1